jgi:hypothetical protein
MVEFMKELTVIAKIKWPYYETVVILIYSEDLLNVVFLTIAMDQKKI